MMEWKVVCFSNCLKVLNETRLGCLGRGRPQFYLAKGGNQSEIRFDMI